MFDLLDLIHLLFVHVPCSTQNTWLESPWGTNNHSQKLNFRWCWFITQRDALKIHTIVHLHRRTENQILWDSAEHNEVMNLSQRWIWLTCCIPPDQTLCGSIASDIDTYFPMKGIKPLEGVSFVKGVTGVCLLFWMALGRNAGPSVLPHVNCQVTR